MYAPYIIDKTGEGLNFHLTDNAYLKFSDLLTEGSHQENDLGIMLHIEGRINRLTMHLTDCLSDKFIQKLTAREWSRNKSKYRLMKKHKNFEVILRLRIFYLILMFQNQMTTLSLLYSRIMGDHGKQ